MLEIIKKLVLRKLLEIIKKLLEIHPSQRRIPVLLRRLGPSVGFQPRGAVALQHFQHFRKNL